MRTHRGYGIPIALQGLWRTADRVDRDLLEAVHAALRAGPLGRRVVRPSVPGARRRWQSSTRAHPLEYGDQVIPVSGLLDWAETTGDDLDPEFGPGWRLAAVPLDDGGSVVSLTCSHVLADGRALAIAVDDALRVAANGDRSRVRADHLRPTSDWADARRQWTTVLGGTARAALDGIPHGLPDKILRKLSDTSPRATAPRPMNQSASKPSSQRSGPSTREHSSARKITNHAAVVQIPVDAWNLTAQEHGSTPNSLFIWTIARILWDAGFPEPRIEASLPVDTRAEPRVNNDLAVTSVTLTRTDTPATIREKSRAAYEYRMTSPAGLPEEILQVIPDRLAATLSAGAGERDILCSNIGQLPLTLNNLGPHHCTGVAARAIHPGLTTLPRTRLSAYLCTTGSLHTLALTALDHTHFPTPYELHKHLKSATALLSLPTHFW
nr:hypothetical protein [Nocardia bovistercoris]